MLFPHSELPFPKIGDATVGQAFDSLASGPFDSGREAVLAKRDTAIFDLQVAWARQCWNRYNALRKFHRLMRGKYGRFTFEIPFGAGYLPNDRLGYEGVYVGVGDGVTTDWDLPVINLPDTIDDEHLRLEGNGTTYVNVAEYVMTGGVGADGRVRATFWVAPASGVLLTLSGLFCPAIWARFGSDMLSWKPNVGNTVDIATPIHEDRPL